MLQENASFSELPKAFYVKPFSFESGYFTNSDSHNFRHIFGKLLLLAAHLLNECICNVCVMRKPSAEHGKPSAGIEIAHNRKLISMRIE